MTFFVLSVGLMGLAALQVKAVKYNQSAYTRSQATAAATSILDSIRVSGGAAPLAADKVEWDAFLSTSLPGGNGTVVCAGTGICTVTISWSDTLAAAGNDTLTVTSLL